MLVKIKKQKEEKEIKDFNINEFASTVLGFAIKLREYHWTCGLLSCHKLSEELDNSLRNLLDEFVEAYLGREKEIELDVNIKVSKYSESDFNDLLNVMKSYFESQSFDRIDLENILADMMQEVNKGIYLSTFK